MSIRICIVIPDPKKLYRQEENWQKYPHTFCQRYLRYGSYALQHDLYDRVFQIVYDTPALSILQSIHHPQITYLSIYQDSNKYWLPSLASINQAFTHKTTFTAPWEVSALRNRFFTDISSYNTDIALFIKCYSPNDEIHRLGQYICQHANSRNISINSCTIIWEKDRNIVENLGGKSFLHQSITNNIEKDTDTINTKFRESFHSLLPEWYHVPAPHTPNKAYIVQIIEWLFEKTKIDKRIIKAIHGSSWEWIHVTFRKNGKRYYYDKHTTPHLLSTFTFPMWDVIIEELIPSKKIGEILTDSSFDIFSNDSLSLTTHFQQWKVFWDPIFQLTINNEWVWNLTIWDELLSLLESQGITRQEIHMLNSYTQTCIDMLWLQGDGCIDRIYDERKKKFILLDPNIGRDWGDMPLKRYEYYKKEHLKETTLYFNWCKRDLSVQEKLTATNDTDTSLIVSPVYIYGSNCSLLISANSLQAIGNYMHTIQA